MKLHILGPCKSKYLWGYLSQSTDIKGEEDVLPCTTFSLIQEGNSCASVLSCISALLNGHTKHTRICPFSDCIVCRLNDSEVFALLGNCFCNPFPGKPWTLSPQKIKVQKALSPSTISLILCHHKHGCYLQLIQGWLWQKHENMSCTKCVYIFSICNRMSFSILLAFSCVVA